MKLILASQSPRRRKLLLDAGFQFDTCSPQISENLNKNMSLDNALIDLARRKALWGLSHAKYLKLQDFMVLAADTMVVLNNEVLGKPRTKAQAESFLGRMSGNIHEVKTAFCLVNEAKSIDESHIETSVVTFKQLSCSRIQDYISTGSPFDKAGGYGVQDSGFVQSIDGYESNVIGFPIEVFQNLVRNRGWKFK